MDNKTFTPLALRTEARPAASSLTGTTIMSLLLMAAAAGDLVSLYKANFAYGKPLDMEAVHAAAEKLVGTVEILVDPMTHLATYAALDKMAPGGHRVADIQIPDLRVLHGVLGKFSESGEMAEALARGLFGNFDLVNFSEEMGDDEWFSAIIYDALGLSPEEVRAKVIAKLQKRYPEKFFTQDAAINRDLAGERAVLEGSPA